MGNSVQSPLVIPVVPKDASRSYLDSAVLQKNASIGHFIHHHANIRARQCDIVLTRRSLTSSNCLSVEALRTPAQQGDHEMTGFHRTPQLALKMRW
jgi:hypothetical protein